MGAKYGREIRGLLIKYGCEYIRPGKGDHEIWYSPKTKRTVSVDVGTRNKHTANEILKDAGINYKF
jgi:predicted RNA binding protein YcfA (HicA-like mRNA interferase family)